MKLEVEKKMRSGRSDEMPEESGARTSSRDWILNKERAGRSIPEFKPLARDPKNDATP